MSDKKKTAPVRAWVVLVALAAILLLAAGVCALHRINAVSLRGKVSIGDYRLTDGECLREVQTRNLNALRGVLRRFPEHSVVIGAHGTAVCTLIRHYCPSFGYEDFRKIQPVMPLIVHFVFNGEVCVSISLCYPLNRPEFTLPRILHR